MCCAAFDQLRRVPVPWRIVAVQFGVLALASVAMSLLEAREAWSALCGGLAVVAPNAALARAATRRLGRDAAAGARRFLALTTVKWALAGSLMAGAWAVMPMAPAGFVTGLLAATVAGALAPIWMIERSE